MAIHLCFGSSSETLVTTSRLRLRAINQTTECRRNENHSINSPRLMGHTHYLYKQKILDYSHNTVLLHRYLLHHIHFYLNRKKYINQNNMHPVGCQNSKVPTEYACYGFEFAELRLFSRASPRHLCFSRAWLALYVIPPVRPIPVFTPYHVYNPCISFPALFSTCIFSCAWYALFVNQRLLLIPYVFPRFSHDDFYQAFT